MLTPIDLSRGEKVPLFNTIAIETSALCNRTCVFCPNHTTTRPDEYLSGTLIRKIIRELAVLRYKGRITTYIYNEPMRDERLPQILEYISLTLPRACVMVSTNGDYLKGADDIRRLFAAGVRQLVINIYSAADGCGDPVKEAKGTAIAAARADDIENILTLLGVDQTSSMYEYVPEGVCRARVERKYGVTKDTKRLHQFELTNRSGNIQWMAPSLKEPLAAMCVRPWRFLNINWKGDAILCCNDYHGTTAFGNVADRTVEELWNDVNFNRYRLALQQKDRHVPLCDKCDYSGGLFRHMIHPVTFGSAEADAHAMQPTP